LKEVERPLGEVFDIKVEGTSSNEVFIKLAQFDLTPAAGISLETGILL